jgi:hypothetical protein
MPDATALKNPQPESAQCPRDEFSLFSTGWVDPPMEFSARGRRSPDARSGNRCREFSRPLRKRRCNIFRL